MFFSPCIILLGYFCLPDPLFSPTVAPYHITCVHCECDTMLVIWCVVWSTGLCESVIRCLLSAVWCGLQGCEHVDLIAGGSDIAVNSSNVHDYVRKYAEYRMVKAVSKPLEVGTLLQNFCHHYKF